MTAALTPELIAQQLKRIGASSVLCYALHWIGARTLARMGPASLRPAERLYLAELLPSTAHAIALGSAATYYIFVRKVWHEDLVEPYPEGMNWFLAFSTAYSVHDSIVMIKHGEHFTMYAHHIAMALGSFLMSLYQRAAFCPTFFYVAEWTIPFQNALYLAEKTGAPKSIVSVLLLLRLVVFVALRTLQLPEFVLFMRSRGLSFIDAMRRVAKPVAALTLTNIITISLLNTVWSIAVWRRSRPAFQHLKALLI
jgi:hypothetical protein